MGRIIPYIMENKKWLKPPTRYKSKQTWRKSKSNHWLVVYLPLWKIWVRQLGWWNSQYMEIHKIHVPKHQPDVNLIMLVLWPVINMNQHGTALWPGGKIISCAAGLGCWFNSKESFLAPLFLGVKFKPEIMVCIKFMWYVLWFCYVLWCFWRGIWRLRHAAARSITMTLIEKKNVAGTFHVPGRHHSIHSITPMPLLLFKAIHVPISEKRQQGNWLSLSGYHLKSSIYNYL